MNATSRTRSEAGFSTLTTIIGSVLGALVLGGLMVFLAHAQDGAGQNVSISHQETSAVTTLNRVGHDIGDADAVVANGPTDVVVQKTTSDGRNRVITRTRFVVAQRTVNGRDTQAMLRQVDNGAPAVYSAATFQVDEEQVLATNVDETKTKFTYLTAKGTNPASASEVGRVDITYVAHTSKGEVSLKSSVTVKAALGGTGNTLPTAPPATNPPTAAPTTAAPPPVAPDAVDDPVTIPAGTSQTVAVLTNDTYTGTPIVTSSNVALATVSVASNQVTVTVSGSVSSTTTITIPYTLKDDTGLSDTANIVVNATVVAGPTSAAASAPSAVDYCRSGDPADSLTIPNDPAADYKVDGVAASPGVQTVTGNVTKTVTATAKSGYALTGTTSWSFTFSNAVCTSVLAAWVSEGPLSLADADGKNSIDWSGGALRYVRMVGSDANAASGQVSASASGSTVQTVGLDTDYMYFVDTNGNGAYDSGAETSFRLVQYPSVPTVTAAGSDRNFDTVVDAAGTDLVSWTKKATTSTTDVNKYTSYMSLGTTYLRSPTSVATGVAGTSTTIANATGGSEAIYDAIAVTRCVTSKGGALQNCPSYNSNTSTRANVTGVYASLATARAYQAPSIAPKNVTAGVANADNCMGVSATGATVQLVNNMADDTASNLAYSCLNGQSSIGWDSDSVADEGQTADAQFCTYAGDPGKCRGKADPVTGGLTPTTSAVAADVSVQVTQSNWNAQDTWKAYACNLGGCSTTGTTKVIKSFPKAFEMQGLQEPPNSRQWDLTEWTSACSNWGSSTTNGCTTNVNNDAAIFQWSNSTNLGGGTYSFDAVAKWGVAANYAGTDIHIANIPSSQSKTDYRGGIQMSSGYYATATAISSVNPGFVRYSTAPGTARVDTRIYTSPGQVSYIQDSAFCNAAVDDGWRYGYWFTTQMIDANGTIRNGTGAQVRHMWWAGKKQNAASETETGKMAADRWLAADSPFTGGPGSWANGEEHWVNKNDGPTANAWVTEIPGTNTQTIPPDGATFGGRTHLRIEVFITKSAAADSTGAVDIGDFTYWDGTTGGAGTTGLYGSSMAGGEIRVRSVNNTAADVKNCPAASKSDAANYSFGSGFGSWYTMSNGAAVTRRYYDTPNNVAPAAGRKNPNPAVTGFAPWVKAQ